MNPLLSSGKGASASDRESRERSRKFIFVRPARYCHSLIVACFERLLLLFFSLFAIIKFLSKSDARLLLAASRLASFASSLVPSYHTKKLLSIEGVLYSAAFQLAKASDTITWPACLRAARKKITRELSSLCLCGCAYSSPRTVKENSEHTSQSTIISLY